LPRADPEQSASAIVDFCTEFGLTRQNDGESGEMSDREQVREQTSGRLGDETGLTCPECGGASVGRVLAQVPIGIVTVDANLRVEYLNPAARVYLGGGTVGALLPDPLPRFSLRKFAGRLFGPSPALREIVETPSGRFLEVEGIHAGATSSAVLILQDVSARERQRRAERDFVSNAAHELRTPIAAINSAVEVLLGGAEASAADRELFLGHIGRESARLERLADALLLLARIQTGQEQPTLELVEIAPLLEDVATRLEPSAGVALHVRCGPAVLALSDRVLLRQAVWNVAANAARHTKSGSIVLYGRDLGSVAELEVEDTGSGIAPADRERAFERFSRGGRPPGGGAGLGLSIAREIIGALGGSIHLDSELGQGTQVRLRVPSARVIPR
jgi:signal transduction histidine kinase